MALMGVITCIPIVYYAIYTHVYIYTYNTYLYILLSIMDTYIDCSDCLYLFIGFKYLAQVSLVLGRHRR